MGIEVIPKQHFIETGILARQLKSQQVGDWLLSQGYFPEQYVLPPCFSVSQFDLRKEPIFPLANNKISPLVSRLLTLSFPKSEITQRVFGVMDPRIYHDIVWNVVEQWEFLVENVFDLNTQIYGYSFPIPLSTEKGRPLGRLRSGRMIYEFIEMAEKDLVAEAHNYDVLIRTDIQNFYATMYTHSLAWALHGKAVIRSGDNRWNHGGFLGNRLDKLFQTANDSCTNGLPVGPAVSDLAAEVLLAVVDRGVSDALTGIEFLGVRFKDDYRILCKGRDNVNHIIKKIQDVMQQFNLSINEPKTRILELPYGLYRPGFIKYQSLSLKDVENISFKQFELAYLNVLQIDAEIPGTGIIDKFLSELVTKDYKLKLKFSKDRDKEIPKMLSLLFLLRRRRAKAFPFILAILELLIQDGQTKSILDRIWAQIYAHFHGDDDHLYEDLWLLYFMKSHGMGEPSKISSGHPFLKSIRADKQSFFEDDPDIKLYTPIGSLAKHGPLARYLAVFPADDDGP